MSVAQVDLAPLERFQYAVNGYGRISVQRKSVLGRSELHIWRCQRPESVERILLDLWPYLSTPKQEQATLASDRYHRRALKRPPFDDNGHQSVCSHGHVFSVVGSYVDGRGRRECAACRYLRRPTLTKPSWLLVEPTYLLRVPPTMRSCAEAVAWTFELTEKEYQPAVES